MNEDFNREMLTELRRLRRLAQWSLSLSVLAFAVISLIAYYAFVRPRMLRSVDMSDPVSQQAAPDTEDAWGEIQAYLDRGNYSTALSLARAMTNRAPTDQFPYACLGRVYLAMGDLANAEAFALRAYELYPIEENEKALLAIRKRMAREKGTPTQ